MPTAPTLCRLGLGQELGQQGGWRACPSQATHRPLEGLQGRGAGQGREARLCPPPLLLPMPYSQQVIPNQTGKCVSQGHPATFPTYKWRN